MKPVTTIVAVAILVDAATPTVTISGMVTAVAVSITVGIFVVAGTSVVNDHLGSPRRHNRHHTNHNKNYFE